MVSRSAIHANGIVVCERNFQTKSTLLGSPFCRAFRSPSLQHGQLLHAKADSGCPGLRPFARAGFKCP